MSKLNNNTTNVYKQQQADAEDFLDVMFSEIEEGEYVGLSLATLKGSPGVPIHEAEFFKRYFSPKIMGRKHDDMKCYVSTASLKPVGAEDGRGIRNSLESFNGLHFFILDDIGTKCSVEDLPDMLRDPTYKIETSEDNFQYGYKLESPIRSSSKAAAFIKALYAAGKWDGGGSIAPKYVRMPCGFHGADGWELRLDEFNPARVFDPQRVLDVAGAAEVLADVPEAAGGGLGASMAKPEDDVVLEWLDVEGLNKGMKDGWATLTCPWAGVHSAGGNDDAGYAPLGRGGREHRGFNCLHDHCRERSTRNFLDWVAQQGGPLVDTSEIEAELPDVATVSEGLQSLEKLTVGKKVSPAWVAGRVIEKVRGQYMWAHDDKGHGTWLGWDGLRWSRDKGRGFNCALGRLVLSAVPGDTAMAGRSAFVDDVKKWISAEPGMSALRGEFDRDNYKLCTPGGVVDLKTGLMVDADQSMLMAHRTAVSPVSGLAKNFLQFMREICDGDMELVEFLQRALGSTLSGAVEEHWMMFWIGGGRNGKNTLGDLVQDALGDYAGTLPSRALMSQKFKGHETEIMIMMGRRLITSSEIEVGSYWDETTLKDVTGNKWLVGRYMREDHVKFERTHKNLVYGNHKPRLKASDMGIKSRLRIVPFNVSFAGREDMDLPAQLREESGQVLSWLVEGHLKWLANSKQIGTCTAVEAATASYFEAQGTVANFIDDCCEKGDFKASTMELFAGYQKWKLELGEEGKSMANFSNEMSTFFKAGRIRLGGRKSNPMRGFYGVKLCAGGVAENGLKVVDMKMARIKHKKPESCESE